MTLAFEQADTFQHLTKAVHRSPLLSGSGLLERGFTLAFKQLVYAQIWEDPEVDMEALSIGPEDHVVAIASGGCNVLSYLTANPGKITAVDLNASHIALNSLKIAALRHAPDHGTFYRFIGQGRDKSNLQFYRDTVRGRLDPAVRTYWDGRGLNGRRRIGIFTRNPYRSGLLGNFISIGHLIARAHGVDLRVILRARTIEEQRRIFDRTIAPLFSRRLVRWLARQPAFLYGLGIPPAQFHSLAGGPVEQMPVVLQERLRRLACDFPLRENYFARQAFGRSYDGETGAHVPPYLAPENFETVRSRVDRVELRHGLLIDEIRRMPDNSADCFILLDAQDWMSGPEINELWKEVTRAGRPGARVLFRTAAALSHLPGALDANVLSCWSYDEEKCRDWTARDRSAIYGGVHLYTLTAKP